MAIKRRPKATVTSVDEKVLDAFIHKGGEVAHEDAVTTAKDVKFTLTIPALICQQLDTFRADLPLKTSRHKWVLEAIVEKIQRS